MDLEATPSRPAPAGPGGLSLLDLDDRPAVRPAAPPRPTRRPRPEVRVAAGTRFVFTPARPTVTLDALQSGIGVLTIEGIAAAGRPLPLGALYEFTDGTASTVETATGRRFAPPQGRRPVLVAGDDEHEHIAIDLRQVRTVRRLVIYSAPDPAAGRAPAWSGALVTRTFGGARVELPLEGLVGGDIAALLSIYNVGGQLVLRAEMQALVGDVREAARAFGFSSIAWLDPRTPLD